MIRNWPWMLDKKDVYTSESEYKFGANLEEILRTDAEIIVNKFFGPNKVLTSNEYQECLDLTKEMVLTAWGKLYSHLSTSEKGSDIEYCENKYEEFLETLHNLIPKDCPGPEEYICRWARKLGKDKKIYEFLYTHQSEKTIR